MNHARDFRILLNTALWLLASVAAAAQWTPFPPEQLSRIQQGIHDIYNLDYSKAIENFQGMIKESPDDPAGYAYLAFTYWVQELNSNQQLSLDRFAASDFFSKFPKYVLRVKPEVEDRFKMVSSLAIQKANAQLKKDPRDNAARYLLGLAYQNQCSFETALLRDWWGATRDGLRTYDYHSRLLREHPDFNDARLAIGVHHYVPTRLPLAFRFLILLIGRRGNREKGIEELTRAMEKGVLAADDARIILILIYTREKKYQEAMEYLSELHKKYPQNHLIPLDMGGVALLMKQPARAIEIYEDILRRRDAGEPKYSGLERASLYNRLAVAHRDRGDLDASRGLSEKALKGSQGPRTRTLAHLELGKTLDLMGLRADAVKHYESVSAAEDVAGSRDEAQRYVKKPYRRD